MIISGQHQNDLYKTKSIAFESFEQENFKPTKSKHPTPLLVGPSAPGASTKSKSNPLYSIYSTQKIGSNTPLKVISDLGTPRAAMTQQRLKKIASMTPTNSQRMKSFVWYFFITPTYTSKLAQHTPDVAFK